MDVCFTIQDSKSTLVTTAIGFDRPPLSASPGSVTTAALFHSKNLLSADKGVSRVTKPVCKLDSPKGDGIEWPRFRYNFVSKRGGYYSLSTNFLLGVFCCLFCPLPWTPLDFGAWVNLLISLESVTTSGIDEKSNITSDTGLFPLARPRLIQLRRFPSVTRPTSLPPVGAKTGSWLWRDNVSSANNLKDYFCSSGNYIKMPRLVLPTNLN